MDHRFLETQNPEDNWIITGKDFISNCKNKQNTKETFASSLIKNKNASPWCCNDGGSDCIGSGTSWPPQGNTWTPAPPTSSGGETTHAQSSACAAVPSSAARPHPVYSEKSPTPKWRPARLLQTQRWTLLRDSILFQECTMNVQHLTFTKPFSVSSNGWIISFACWLSAVTFSYSNTCNKNSPGHCSCGVGLSAIPAVVWRRCERASSAWCPPASQVVRPHPFSPLWHIYQSPPSAEMSSFCYL